MALLGPASEMHTYLLMALATALAVVESFSGRLSVVSRTLAGAAYLFFLLAILRVAFIPRYDNAWLLGLQAVGTLVFLAYALRHYGGKSDWKTPAAS